MAMNKTMNEYICPLTGTKCLGGQCPFYNYKNDTCILVRACISVISTNSILREDKDNDRERTPIAK